MMVDSVCCLQSLYNSQQHRMHAVGSTGWMMGLGGWGGSTGWIVGSLVVWWGCVGSLFGVVAQWVSNGGHWLGNWLSGSVGSLGWMVGSVVGWWSLAGWE